MSLLDEAAADLREILTDVDGGFAVPLVLVSPNGEQLQLNGLANNIGTSIDPETGQAVLGQQATIAISIADIEAEGVELPRGTADKNSRPWVVRLTLPTGGEQKFKISATAPDLLGCLVCHLEEYCG